MKAKLSPQPRRVQGVALPADGGQGKPRNGRQRSAPMTAPMAAPTAHGSGSSPATEAEGCEFTDPEATNHALLVLLQEEEKAAHLRPCDIAQQMGIGHQHHHKMRPRTAPEKKEMHVSFVTVIKWCIGKKKSVRKLIEQLRLMNTPGSRR